METILVFLIVGLAVAGLVRQVYKNLTGEKASCGCQCSGCGMHPGSCHEKALFQTMPED